MKNGNILIGVFVKKFKIKRFIGFLRKNLSLDIDKLYIFNVEKNNTEYLVTFSSNKENHEFMQLHDATILHTKNQCLFSINALNSYIEKQKIEKIENVEFEVNWSNLKNTLLIMSNGEFKKLKLNRINLNY